MGVRFVSCRCWGRVGTGQMVVLKPVWRYSVGVAGGAEGWRENHKILRRLRSLETACSRANRSQGTDGEAPIRGTSQKGMPAAYRYPRVIPASHPSPHRRDYQTKAYQVHDKQRLLPNQRCIINTFMGRTHPPFTRRDQRALKKQKSPPKKKNKNKKIAHT